MWVIFPLGSLWRKRQLPTGWFITAVSGMGWTTFLGKIMISLSLIHTYHPVLYELYHLSCWQRGQAEGWQPQEGRSKTRSVAPGWGGLAAHMTVLQPHAQVFFTVQPLEKCSSVVQQGRKTRGGSTSPREQKWDDRTLSSMSTYSVPSRSYGCGSGSYLPHNRLFQFLKMGRRLLSKIFYWKMFIGIFY